jgi:peptidyl-prolyl cis-trans isomerase C
MHKRIILALPVLALAGLLAGCGAGSNSGNTANNNATTMNATSTSAPASGTVLVTVNGHPITASEVNAFVALRTHGQKIHLNAMQRHQVAEQMIQFNLMYQAALKDGLQNNPDVQQNLALQKKLFLASQAVQHYMDTAQVPNSKLHAQYKKLEASEGGKQYKARHILVKKKSEAEKIIKQLDNGGDFAKLAKKDSIDKGSAKQGGELGWFKPKQMVPPFSAAVEKLKKGHYTEKPVKSQFGWHVIKLQDERTSAPPSFTSSKPMLEKQARNSMLRDHIKTLQSQADIDWKVPNPASAAAAKRAAAIRHAQQTAAAQSVNAATTAAAPAPAPVPATH